MTDEVLDVVWPLGGRELATSTVIESTDMAGSARRIGFAWDLLFRGDRMWTLIQSELGRLWPDAVFVGPEEFGNIHDRAGDDISNERLTLAIREHKVSAVIVGVGA